MGFDPWELREHRKLMRTLSPPTNRQLKYIESLCEDLGFDEHSSFMPESFVEASDIIDDLKFELGYDN